MIKKLLLPLLALALVGWAVWNVFGMQRAAGKTRKPVAPPKSPFVHSVAGAGMVEPRTESSGTATTAVGSELGGVVAHVRVHVGSDVKKGDPLFSLDDRALQADLNVKQANLLSAQKALKRLEQMPRPEDLPPAEAKVAAARESFRAAEDAYRRAVRAGQGATAAEVYQLREAREVAQANLAGVQKQLDELKAGAWDADKEVARAAEAQAQAAVDQVQTDLKRQVVLAPITGRVLQVNIREGESVSPQPGQALMMMGDVSVLHVRVQFDESDIAHFKQGAPALALTRGLPQKEVPLKFVRIEPYVVPKKSLTGDNTERVDTRVMQVIYAIDTPNPPVQLGQQLDVFVNLDGQA
jgi:multidrug resistance efflux pump